MKKTDNGAEDIASYSFEKPRLSFWHKISPYKALFSCKIKIGPNTSNLPHNVISMIENEEQLAELITEQTPEINIENELSRQLSN